MPEWERRTRWIFTLVVLAWLVATTAAFSDYIFHIPIPFVLLVFLTPLITCLFLKPGNRGWFGAIFMLLISSFVFFGVLPAILSLFIGTSGLGLVDRYLDWTRDVDQGGGLVMMLTVRAAIIFSVAIFLVIARLMQYQSISKISGSRVFKAAAIGAVLLPLMFTRGTSYGETNADPTAPPNGISSGGAEVMLTPDVFQTSRVLDPATGMWTYATFFSNPTQTDLTVTQVWAGRDAISPFSERVAIDGSGVRIGGEGIIFGAGGNGTIRFSAVQGHNKVTVLSGNGGRYTISWTEQI